MKNNNKLLIVDGLTAIKEVTFLDDRALGFKARGILSFLSAAGRKNQLVPIPDMSQFSNDGDHSIRSGIKELLRARYLHFVQVRGDDGRIQGVVYVATMMPTNPTKSELIRLVDLAILDSKKPANSPHRDFRNPGKRKFYKENCILLRNILNLNYNYNTSNELLNYNLNGFFPKSAQTKKQEDCKKNTNILWLFDHWNMQKSLPSHRKGAQYKSYKDAMKKTERALRRYDAKTIARAISDYAWLLEQPHTVLRSARSPMRVGMPEFFGFSAWTSGTRAKEGHPLFGVSSWMGECKKGRAYLIRKYGAVKKDSNPKITALLARAVVASGIFGVREIDRLDPSDVNSLVVCSGRIRDFIESHADRLPKRDKVKFCVDRLISHLSEISGQVHFGYLCSDITWKNLERSMVDKGSIRSSQSVNAGFRNARGHATSK